MFVCRYSGCYSGPHVDWYWIVIAAVVIYAGAILLAWIDDRYF